MAANPVAAIAAAAAATATVTGCSSSSLATAAAAPSRVYRILHFTDIHFTVRPTWRECWSEPKRLLGLLNHSIGGRAAHFSRRVQSQLVSEVTRHQPTQVVISGDLTSFATDSEFETAYEALRPILRPAAQPHRPSGTTHSQPAFSHTSQLSHQQSAAADTQTSPLSSSFASSTTAPSATLSDSPPSLLFDSGLFRTLLISGNHDVYTVGSVRSRLFDRWFGHWRLPTARILSVAPDLHFVAIDACQPNKLASHGHVDQQQLALLRATLSSPSLRSSFVVLVCHYPLLDRDGADYSARHSWHGIDNNSQVCAAVRESLTPLLTTQHSQPNMQSAHSSPPLSPSLLVRPALPAAPPSISPSTQIGEGVASGVRGAVGTSAVLLHGHVHRGYCVPFPLLSSNSSSASIPIYNPGSAGRSFCAGKRAAAYNLYTISRQDDTEAADSNEVADSGCHVHHMNGWRMAVERFVHNGQTFDREQQGPYSSPY